MSIQDLSKGEVFELEGCLYEVISIGERIILCYELDGAMELIPDLASADGWKSTAFSDLRYYREHGDPANDLL